MSLSTPKSNPSATPDKLVVASEVQRMFGSIAERYDITNSVLSMGIHFLWRRRLFSQIELNQQQVALDLCTGTGDLLLPLLKRCRLVCGADFCLPMLQAGKKRSGHKALNFLQADALKLPFADQTFDLLTISFGIRNLENLQQGLHEMRRVLKPQGRLAVLEFGQPKGIFGLIFGLYSKYIIPLIGGILTGNREAYEYLPETSKRFPCGEKFREILKLSGFEPLLVEAQTGGIAFLYLAQRSK